MSPSPLPDTHSIRAIDGTSVHRITSGQVAVDLQTVVKELVENALDAKATNIEVKLKEFGIASIEVVDNGVGIAPEDYPSVALKHHTSKLSTFEDLTTVSTFGFRGEALSSLCALCEKVGIVTATAAQGSLGTVLEFGKDGQLTSCDRKTARQRGTTVTLTGLFAPLPVRRKELERNAKREFGKMLQLMHAYALVPCTKENEGVRLSVSNQASNGRKAVQLKNERSTSLRAAVSSLWGPKTLDTLVELDLQFDVETERTVLRRRGLDISNAPKNTVRVHGLVSKFSPGCGRAGADRQFFYVNGRPCNPAKVQKAVNEVYKTFNAAQTPLVVADFVLPRDSCDINASPDKRTILLHSEANLVEALKAALVDAFSASRSTFTMNGTQGQATPPQTVHRSKQAGQAPALKQADAEIDVDVDEEEAAVTVPGEEGEEEEEEEDGLAPRAKRDANTKPLSRTPIQRPRACVPPPQVPRSSTPPASPRPLEHDADAENADEEPKPSQGKAGRSAGRVERIIAAAPNSVRKGSRGDASLSTSTSSRASVSIANHTARAVPVSGGKPREREVQMVLDTSGASWNLRPGSGEPPRKKARVEGGGSTRADMREKLKGFARVGSRVEREAGDEETRDEEDAEDGKGQGEDEDEDDEMVEEINEEEHTVAEEVVPMEVDADEGSVAIEASTAFTTTWTTETDELKDDVSSPSPPQPSRTRPKDMGPRPQGPLPPASSDNDDVAPPAKAIPEPPAHDAAIIDLTDPLPPDADPSSSVVPESSHAYSASTRADREDEFVRTVDDAVDGARLAIDLARIARIWGRALHGLRGARKGAAPRRADAVAAEAAAAAAGVGNADNERAAAALARVLCKEDFLGMDVVGQFNMGFIIARRRTAGGGDGGGGGGGGGGTDDLFIVDQHAADEKYNFEALQRETRIASQNLFRPRELELPAADELVAIENAEVLRQNGFEIVVDEDGDGGGDGDGDGDRPSETVGRRVKLVAQPVSKNVVFDLRDLEELLHLMRDRPTGTMVRCSKARAMFASRACRKSIMVGQALTAKQMSVVVRHMATMDQPWNCPHGRPTMRHLADVRAGRAREGRGAGVEWSRFALG